jgi:hypothetical protein
MATSAYGQKMIARLLMQFSHSPNLHGLLDALGVELDLLSQVFSDLQNKRWIDTAEGVQLDGCGIIVDQSRRISKAITIPFFGFAGQIVATGFNQGRIRKDRESYLSSAVLADEEYRKVLWQKIAKNTTDGTVENTIQNLYKLYGAKIVVTEIGNAKIMIAIGKTLTDAEIILTNALNLLIRAGGVDVAFKSHFPEGGTFGFSEQNQGYLGFGKGALAKDF